MGVDWTCELGKATGCMQYKCPKKVKKRKRGNSTHRARVHLGQAEFLGAKRCQDYYSNVPKPLLLVYVSKDGIICHS